MKIHHWASENGVDVYYCRCDLFVMNYHGIAHMYISKQAYTVKLFHANVESCGKGNCRIRAYTFCEIDINRQY